MFDSRVEIEPKSAVNGKEKEEKKSKHEGSDVESLGSDFSDSFENDSDQEEKEAKNSSSKSGDGKMDSPKINSARARGERPDSAKSGSGKVDSLKSSRSRVSSARDGGPSSARSNKSYGMSSLFLSFSPSPPLTLSSPSLYFCD